MAVKLPVPPEVMVIPFGVADWNIWLPLNVWVFALYLETYFLARIIFGSCCLSMMVSIIFFIREIQISTRALRLHLSDMDDQFKE